jgi:cytochrome c oxidase assembly protein subunit 15
MTALGHRLALATAGATLLLILFGGLVTNTGSALAVPDWPTTFGYTMFTYPWSGMVGGVFYEHSHRLLGSLVGLLTVALAAALWRAGGRLRVLGLVAVAGVVAQGVIGGLRVVFRQDTLAIVHGCVAPAFFALIVAIVLLTSARARFSPGQVDGGARSLALLAVGLVYIQIVLGALVTHAGFLQVHLVGALAVFAFVPLVTARMRRSGDAVAAPVARAVLVLLGFQLLLGIGAWVASTNAAMLVPAVRLALPVAHRLTGSLILAGMVILALRTLGISTRQAGLADAIEQLA